MSDRDYPTMKEYGSTKAVLAHVRYVVRNADPGAHYSVGCNFYQIAGGHVEVDMVPASDGGVLLGRLRRYRVADAKGAFSRWRTI